MKEKPVTIKEILLAHGYTEEEIKAMIQVSVSTSTDIEKED
jgi:hypothetical protein